MLEVAELELKMGKAGVLNIPPEASDYMDIHEGDPVRLICLTGKKGSPPAPAKEIPKETSRKPPKENPDETPRDILFISGHQDISDLLQGGADLNLSGELLKEAGIPPDADLEMTCRDGEIVIRPTAEENSEDIPRPPVSSRPDSELLLSGLLEAAKGMGIPKENIQVVLHMPDRLGKEDSNGKTSIQTDR